MKTSRLILISAIMSFAFLGFSVTQTTTDNTQITEKHPGVKIHVNEVTTNNGLYEAVVEQVRPDFLLLYHPGFYVFHVKFHSQEYLVFGQHKDWKIFFNSENVIGGH